MCVTGKQGAMGVLNVRDRETVKFIKTEKSENDFISNSHRFPKSNVSGRFPGFARSSLWYEQRVGHWWNDSCRGKPRYVEYKAVRLPLCPPKIPH